VKIGAIGFAFFLFGCIEDSLLICDNGLACPVGTTCDAVHARCVHPEQLTACESVTDGSECMFDGAPGVCDAGVCLRFLCGDGYRAPGEMCDGASFGSVDDCTHVGFYDAGPLDCTSTCELDTSRCTGSCGDGLINGPELCDGDDPTNSCLDFGYGAGHLGCALCGPAFSECIPFGWRREVHPEAVRHLHGTSETNVWVVGNNKMVRRFDGTSWHDVPVSCASGDIYRVFAVSDTDAFMLDSTNQLIRVTAQACTSWPAPDPMGPQTQLWAFSAAEAYAGTDGGLFHLQQESWNRVHSTGVSAIWASGPSDVYSGSIMSGTLQHYDGQSWGTVSVPGMGSVLSIFGNGADDFYVGGSDLAVRARLVQRTVSGWTTVLSDLPILASGNGLSAVVDGGNVGSRTIVRATPYGGARDLVLASDGSGWADLGAPIPTAAGALWVSPSGTPSLGILDRGLTYVFENTALVETAGSFSPIYLRASSADAAYAADNYNELYVWNGKDWRSETPDVADVYVAPTGEVFVVGFTYGLRQRTAPETFVAVSPATRGRRIVGTSATDMWIVKDSTTMTHWTGSATDYTLPISSVDAAIALSPTRAFVFGHLGDVAQWNGSTWDPFAIPLGPVIDAWAESPTHAYAWNTTSVMHFDGTSWSVLSDVPMTTIRSVWGHPADLFIGGDTGLFHFDGLRWSPVDAGDDLGVSHVSGSGDSLYLSTPLKRRQLIRTRPW
jgi:hypothetical protein